MAANLLEGNQTKVDYASVPTIPSAVFTVPTLALVGLQEAQVQGHGLDVMTADLLRDVLPIGEALNAATVRNYLQAVARLQEASLGEEQFAFV